MVNQDELLHLSQDQIKAPMFDTGVDTLEIGVLRPGKWQTLFFPAPESRKPLEHVLNPMLHWLEDLENDKHISLPEDSARNNCLPSGEIKLKTRPDSSELAPPANNPAASTVSGSSLPFVLRLVQESYIGAIFEKTCIIVYAEGRFHRERATKDPYSAFMHTAIFEDVIPAAEIANLRAILDRPDFVNWPYQRRPVYWDGSAFLTLFIARGDSTQKLTFWKNNGMNIYKPIGEWLNTNAETRKTPPLKNSRPTQCIPPSS